LSKYCEKWKLVVNVNKTKVMVFRKRGRLKRELRFYYNNNEVAKVSQFTYLGIIFTTGKSFKQTFDSLHGQSMKSIFWVLFGSMGLLGVCRIRHCTFTGYETTSRCKDTNSKQFRLW